MTPTETMVANCDTYVADLEHQLCSRERRPKKRKSMRASLRGLEELLETLEFFGDTESDGNPILQHLTIDPAKILSPRTTSDFQLVTVTMAKLLRTVHRAVQVSLLDGFWTGKSDLSDARDFTSTMLRCEAAAFYYTDLVLTADLRTRLRHVEVVYRELTATGYFTHPYRAFRGEKKSDFAQTAQIYSDGFLIAAKLRARVVAKPSMAERVASFYNPSQIPWTRLYKSLSKMEYFGAFHKRFCLFDHDLSGVSLEDFFRTGITSQARLPDKRLQQIKLRRKIQIRAYYAWALRFYLRRNNFFSLSGRPLKSRDACLAGTENYLDQLETRLNELCAFIDANPSKLKDTPSKLALIERSLDLDELEYERQVIFPLKRARVWAKRRELATAWVTGGEKRLPSGFSDGGVPTPAQIRSLCKLLFVSEARFAHKPRVLEGHLKVLQKLSQSQSAPEKARLYQKILQDPDVLPLWSQNLAEIGGQIQERER